MFILITLRIFGEKNTKEFTCAALDLFSSI
jgi:hypothetical protein